MKKIFKLNVLSAAVLIFAVGCDQEPANRELSLAVAEAKSGNWQSAEEKALTVTAIDAGDIGGRLLLALCYEEQKKLPEAIDIARTVSVENPENFVARYTYGRLLAASDALRSRDAFDILQGALELRPGDKNTLILLCNLGTRINHPATADYLKELQKFPEFAKSSSFACQMAIASLNAHRHNDALNFFKKSVSYGSANPVLIYNIARRIDDAGLSKRDALALYKLFLSHPGKKHRILVADANARVKKLSGR